jgi:hypothetical protein
MTKTPRCPRTYRGPAPLVNGSCAMTKTPFLGPVTPACATPACARVAAATFEASLPVSRPTSSP